MLGACMATPCGVAGDTWSTIGSRSRARYIYEPAGEAHTLVITEDSPEPMIAFFVVEGGLIYLDKPTNGTFAAYEDGFTLLELTRKHYRDAGLDALKLDLLVR